MARDDEDAQAPSIPRDSDGVLSGLTDLEQRRSGNRFQQAHRDPLLEASITMLRGDIAVLMFLCFRIGSRWRCCGGVALACSTHPPA